MSSALLIIVIVKKIGIHLPFQNHCPVIALFNFIKVRDAGNLLTRAGFAIPAVDVDDIQVQYRCEGVLEGVARGNMDLIETIECPSRLQMNCADLVPHP